MSDVTPARSHAVVVGIERYEAGASWNLDGPASDAVRILEYVAACGVPKDNVEALLSPLPQNARLSERAAELAGRVATPTQAAVDDLIERRLSALTSEFLIVFWAGHGVITVDDERRLYTADATAEIKRNVDVNSLLATLRTDRYPGVPRQAIVVDACANYIPNPTDRLTHKRYTSGAGVAGVEQFALYAASPGEYAKNLNEQKAGLLSRELLAALPAPHPTAWPPNLIAAAEALAARFVALRQARQTRQTPSAFWFRSPTKGGEYRDDGRSLGQMRTPGTAAARTRRKLSPAETRTLVDAFLQLDSMRRQKDRDWIVRQLRAEIGTTVERRDSDRMDTTMILERARYYDGLSELLQIIDTLEAQSPAFTALVAAAHDMLPEEVPATLDS